MAHMFDDVITLSQISSHSAALHPLARESHVARKAPGGPIPQDRLELSEAAGEGNRGQDAVQIRLELVERIRQSVAAGNYLTSDKIDAAVERLYQVLSGQ
jgi:anti-sigma28 factor (negative regulator of flagellin synthesis)